MKKINWTIIRLVLLVVVMLFLFAFSSNRNNNKAIQGIKITFAKGEENFFITDAMVNNLLKQKLGITTKNKKKTVFLNTVETMLNNHAMIENSEVFLTIDGVLHIAVKQKKPIARIMQGNIFYYLDNKGDKMPLSDNFSARVPLVAGKIPKETKQDYIKLFENVIKDDFLQKNITAFQILPSGNVKIKCRAYNYTIELGKPTNIENKFKKYKAFFYYMQQHTNALEQYKTINLMFEKQVVGKK